MIFLNSVHFFFFLLPWQWVLHTICIISLFPSFSTFQCFEMLTNFMCELFFTRSFMFAPVVLLVGFCFSSDMCALISQSCYLPFSVLPWFVRSCTYSIQLNKYNLHAYSFMFVLAECVRCFCTTRYSCRHFEEIKKQQ